MGTHGATGTRARALPPGSNAVSSTFVNFTRRRPLNLSGWPVARRLFAVIVAALLMGVIFGGLRVADAEGSAAQFSQVSRLANLGEKLTTLVNALQNERDETLAQLDASQATWEPAIRPLYEQTGNAAAAVQTAIAGLGGGLPSNIQNDVISVNADIAGIGSTDPTDPKNAGKLHGTLGPPEDDLAVISNYDGDINDMITLADQVGQGVSDASLASDVRALNALAMAKDQASEQRALLNFAFANPTIEQVSWAKAPGVPAPPPAPVNVQTANPDTVQALSVAAGQELADESAFHQAATPAESAYFTDQSGLSGGGLATGIELDIEQNVIANNNTDYLINGGSVDTLAVVPGSQLFEDVGIDVPPTSTPATATTPAVSTPGGLEVNGLKTFTNLTQGQAAWDTGIGDELTAMQNTEQLIAGNIVTRAGQLHAAAQKSALTYGIITVVVLLIVLLAALAVARSVVLPLRRLRAGALDIASVQMPERVRLLTESPEAAASMVVAPINVADNDEIGEVARAFDRVHAEAVRLAGEQALLRSTFNAMFVNLSRRSASLIERLARMIDNLEQTEADPDRLGHLFSMDHLVTRMRRNSENLLLLAGHENPRKWSEPVSLADVARAAISEIEQYNRITLNIPPGIAVAGAAVSDVAHLLAELIENATMFSAKDTQVQVMMQELSSGGVLIEISDKGIGVSEARLAEMNWRLDNRPTIDVSVSRHMGLFAVARLAERHGVRVRLRPALPQGLSALVWLSDSVIERTSLYGSAGDWQSRPPAAAAYGAQSSVGVRQIGGMPEAAAAIARSSSRNDAPAPGPRVAKGWFRGRAADLGGASGASGASRANGGGGAGAAGGEASPWRTPSSPSYDDQTSAGLPVRTPKNSLTPDTVTGNRTGGLPLRSEAARGGPVPGRGPGIGSQPLRRRSPDQVRSRLAGFQRGTRRAETDQGQSPSVGEGNER
jgi:signal transduction histidine kinase